MTLQARNLLRTALVGAFLAAPCLPVEANMTPDWVQRLSVGASLSAGIMDMVVDAAGVTYVTGITGSSSNTDVVTAAYRPDGSLLWSEVFNGPNNWHDQGRGITLGPTGEVYVTGNTPDSSHRANLLLLKYDAATGTLLNMVQRPSGPFASEFGQDVATDAQGGVYIIGGTTGDGPDVLLVKYDSAGSELWHRVWDGPASSPYSLDSPRKILVDHDGAPVALIHGVSNTLHADYVVLKCDPSSGSTTWESTWGGFGEDGPRDIQVDLGGDLYVTGVAFSGINQYGTIKLDGQSGQLLWEAFDSFAFHNFPASLALDTQGGVYITGSTDPDGDESNFNDLIFTVKRDAFSGARRWTHTYGDTCVGCFDAPADVEVDPAGHVFVSGRTSSAPYTNDMITLVLDSDSGLETDRGVLQGTSVETVGAAFQRFDAAHNLYIGGEFYNVNTGQVDISVLRYPTLVSNLHQLSVTNLTGGSTATFLVENGTPLTTQYVLLSLLGPGSVPVPSFGVTLSLESPVLLLFGAADGLGTYSVPVQIPAGAVGRTIWLQAAERNSTTPVLQMVVN